MVDNIGSKKGQDIAIILIVLSVIVIAFLVINKIFKGGGAIMKAIGLEDTDEEIGVNKLLSKNQALAEQANYWSPTLWKQKAGCKIIKSAFADKLVDQIYSSVGYFYDTPSQAVAAFKQLKYKSQISYLADKFNTSKQLDLKTFLNEKFDTTEQKKALNDIYYYVSNLPNGY